MGMTVTVGMGARLPSAAHTHTAVPKVPQILRETVTRLYTGLKSCVKDWRMLAILGRDCIMPLLAETSCIAKYVKVP